MAPNDKDAETATGATDAPARAESAGRGEASGKGGPMSLLIALAGVTAVAVGAGFGLGPLTAMQIENTLTAREGARAEEKHDAPADFGGNIALQPIEAVVTNLAEPADVWVRLESSMIYHPDRVENPVVIAGEIRQDMLAYLRTLNLAQLGSPSALLHLREDLNERARLRAGDKVDRLIVQALIVQ